MGEWIRIADRMPEPGTPIWGLFTRKDGTPRKVNPVRDGDYGPTKCGLCFTFLPHRNWYLAVEYCAEAGLTHWQPRVGPVAPPPGGAAAGGRVDARILSPARIAAAGEDAARAYRGFLDDPSRTPGTRKNYSVFIVRFLRWAEGRGLTLATIDRPALDAYAAEIAAGGRAPAPYLVPVRGLLRHLAAAGILAADPCPPGRRPRRRRPDPQEAPDAP